MSTAMQVAWQTESTVYFIDTSGSFSSQRILQMYKACQINRMDSNPSNRPQITPERLLSKIYCAKVHDLFPFYDLLERIQFQLKEKNTPFACSLKLLIIDSLGYLISPTLGSSQPVGYSMMFQIARMLKYIAIEYEVAILYTNFTVRGNRDEDLKPALGDKWVSVPNTRVLLKKEALSILLPRINQLTAQWAQKLISKLSLKEL